MQDLHNPRLRRGIEKGQRCPAMNACDNVAIIQRESQVKGTASPREPYMATCTHATLATFNASTS
jgi:hypothetical protein